MAIAIGMTIAIVGFAFAQVYEHGDWPPFATNHHVPSVGETGDFVGGWANSLALVWLVAVTTLQYLTLRVQREELRISRDEIKDTREELRKQAEASASQAKHTEAILRLERRRSTLEYVSESRAALRQLLLETIWSVDGSKNNQHLRGDSTYSLVKTLAQRVQNMLDSPRTVEQSRGELARLAEHTREITDLFDEQEELSDFFHDRALRRGLSRFRNASHLYERCRELQGRANALAERDA